MTDTTLTIQIPDEVAADLRRIASEQGVTPEMVAASMTARNVRAIASGEEFFLQRARGGKGASFDKVFAPGRKGGEPPRPGDEAE
jgi:hypothetical protein